MRSDLQVRHSNALLYFAIFGFVAPIVTFAVAIAPFSSAVKITILSILAGLYAMLFFISYYRAIPASSPIQRSDISAKSSSLAAAMKKTVEAADSRFQIGCAVLRGNDQRDQPEVLAQCGELKTVSEVAKRAMVTGEIEVERSEAGGQIAALPIMRESMVFAVLELQFRNDESALSAEILNEFGQDVIPRILAALVSEETVSAAWADPVTSLPNQDAFQIVLEHELADTRRNNNDRPLSVLALDIRDFAAINEKHGFGIGDRLLNFVAETVQSRVRDMDFFARVHGDEFLVVLPAASESGAGEIANRISQAFLRKQFRIDDAGAFPIVVNLGFAVYSAETETAEDLIRLARARKQESKASRINKREDDETDGYLN